MASSVEFGLRNPAATAVLSDAGVTVIVVVVSGLGVGVEEGAFFTSIPDLISYQIRALRVKKAWQV